MLNFGLFVKFLLRKCGATNAGTVTSTSNMHEQERILISAYNLIKAHVEFVANSSADASGIIVSAGMQVAVTGGANAVTALTLEAAGNGEVIIRVPRGSDEKAFIYEAGTDGATFLRVRSSTLTKVTISGYTPGSTIYVRYFAINKIGETTTSQVVSAIVL